ncbi:MAG: hypothetical protein ABR976_07745 [Terracidiphilus sp.]|jgi:hypothetical protein
MKTSSVLAMAVVAFSSLAFSNTSLNAQQPDPAAQQTPATPAATPQTSPGSTQVARPDAANTSAAPVEMRPVNGELVGKLDSKSAKAGDLVVVKTDEAVKTADGTVIPKGSKLVGHVSKVESHSQGRENSAVGIAFDHAELKGGQSVAIESVIKALGPAPGDLMSNTPDATAAPMGASSPAGGGMAGRPGGTTPTSGVGSTPNPIAAQANGSSNNGASNAGTVVGKTGDDPIRTTSIPGVFLASTTPSEAPSLSGMLFAAKSEVHLDGGTQVVLEVATATAPAR